jgi:uncharacterized protein DUF4276
MIGIIVEGDYDREVISVLIQRITEQAEPPVSRICGGPVVGRFPRKLRELKYQNPEKVLIIRDAHGKDPQEAARELQTEIQNQLPEFPVKFVVVVQELEAWLLADPGAVDQICSGRGRRLNLSQLTASPERFLDAKKELEVVLGRAGVAYTKVVAREIAALANLDEISGLAYWCPSFRRFRAAVHDC